MLVRPATLADAATLFRWRSAPAETGMFFGDGDRLAGAEAWFREASRRHKLLVGVHGGEAVGSIIVKSGGELIWTVAAERRGQGLGKRMVRLVVQPGHFARIEADDVASRAIAAGAGFDCIEDGPTQLWRATRVEPYL